jgi:hypothetical protein
MSVYFDMDSDVYGFVVVLKERENGPGVICERDVSCGQYDACTIVHKGTVHVQLRRVKNGYHRAPRCGGFRAQREHGCL